MMGKTSIEWTDAVWNPVTGCTKVSAACKNCYAERLFPRVYGSDEIRMPDIGDSHPAQGTFRKRRFTDIRYHPERLEHPLHWRKPRRIFVCSMSDLFHEAVPDEFIDRVFAAIALCPLHTFQILTKRPQRMLSYLTTQVGTPWVHRVARDIANIMEDARSYRITHNHWGDVVHKASKLRLGKEWPLSNVHLGVSCEDQETADERIPLLLQTPAAVRFVNLEPLLGPIYLGAYITGPSDWAEGYPRSFDWVIVGGESGPKARPMHPDWARSVRDRCHASGVSFFFKQWGQWGPGGGEVRNSQTDRIKMGNEWMSLVGKKRAGRLLDGREWNEFPEAQRV